MKKNFFFLLIGILFFGGCASKNITKADLDERGCEAFNFDTLLLSKARSAEFVDLRSPDERNFQNGLWTTKEYCDMSKLNLTELIVKYGERTKYTNNISVDSGAAIKTDDLSPTRVEISNSKLQYQLQKNKSSFNFVAVNGSSIINFKEGEKVILDGAGYRFYNKREYKNPKELWQIEVIDNQGKVTIFDLNQNKFIFGSYKIIF